MVSSNIYNRKVECGIKKTKVLRQIIIFQTISYRLPTAHLINRRLLLKSQNLGKRFYY